MNFSIQPRDERCIEFLEKFKIASVSQLTTAIYGNDIVARRRLRGMFESKLLRRIRRGVKNEFVYYCGATPPLRVEHHLILVDVYNELIRIGGSIVKWECEPDWGSLRPDAYCVYEYEGKKYHYAIEIERNTNPFNQKKYEDDYRVQAGSGKPRFGSYPKVLVVSDGKIKIETSSIKYVVVNTKLDRLVGYI